MNPNNILSIADMEKPRTVSELDEWVHKIQDRFAKNKKLYNFARQKKGLAKQFYEEIWPLLRYAQAKYSTEALTKLAPVIGSQRFDAIVMEPYSPEYKVEITFAKDGYEEFHKMKLLEQDGHVSVYGDLEVTGTKNMGYSYSMKNETGSLDEVFGKYHSPIIRAYKAKAIRKYEEVETLIIGFDDHMLFSHDEDSAMFKSMILDSVKGVDCSFANVWIVGMSGKFDVRLPTN